MFELIGHRPTFSQTITDKPHPPKRKALGLAARFVMVFELELPPALRVLKVRAFCLQPSLTDRARIPRCGTPLDYACIFLREISFCSGLRTPKTLHAGSLEAKDTVADIAADVGASWS